MRLYWVNAKGKFTNIIYKMHGYSHTGAIDCTEPLNVERLKGKTAIVTGGMVVFSLLLINDQHRMQQAPMA